MVPESNNPPRFQFDSRFSHAFREQELFARNKAVFRRPCGRISTLPFTNDEEIKTEEASTRESRSGSHSASCRLCGVILDKVCHLSVLALSYLQNPINIIYFLLLAYRLHETPGVKNTFGNCQVLIQCGSQF